MASGVELLGSMEASGYQRAPALARRSDGQMIKLTPLLYALAKQVDGQRDHAELAAVLSRRAGKLVSAEDVEFLVENRLAPLGIVQSAEGSAVPLPRANPLLALRPKVVFTSPRVTRALTAPFTWLFHPAVLVPALAAFGALCVWLLADKGLSSALHQAFYEPALILAVWALVIASAAFHEIGHAAACRYGGARPGVMGAGLYLVWPAFYTEVNDAYRLGRRARLRVDLGGLYFSALFALVAFGLWLWTGADAVLLVIAVQMIQMVRQLAPFIRADGYHLIADAIGVPDLFSHIKPTLLSFLPGRRAEGQALKPWARRVVALWVAITVPALLIVLGGIILIFPRLAGTAWDSGGIRWDEVTHYWAEGDLAGTTMSGISILLVALPVASIVYLVAYLGQRLGRKAWRSTAGRPVRRALACSAGVALVGSVAWAWWPDDGYRPVEPDSGGVAPTVLDPAPPEYVAGVPRSLVVPLAPGAAPQAPSPSLLWGVPMQSLPPAPAYLGDADEPIPGPAPAKAPSGDTWPFPFDRIEPARPGDNRALAVNTRDESSLWDFAGALLILTGPEDVDQRNEAFALASCRDCRTGAVAFQIILIVGYVEDILPENAALAVNYECDVCETWALAYQVVASLADVPTSELREALRGALERLERLENRAGELSLVEIVAALDRIRSEVMLVLAEANPALFESEQGEAGAVDTPEPVETQPEASATAAGMSPAPDAPAGSAEASPVEATDGEPAPAESDAGDPPTEEQAETEPTAGTSDCTAPAAGEEPEAEACGSSSEPEPTASAAP